MCAEGAFVGRLRLFIYEPSIVWTRLNTISAANTGFIVDDNDAVFALKCGLHWTDRHTWRVLHIGYISAATSW